VGALDAVATVHLFLETLRLHLPSAGLQKLMMFPDGQGAMRLRGADTFECLGQTLQSVSFHSKRKFTFPVFASCSRLQLVLR
jgi:hypothetical protein